MPFLLKLQGFFMGRFWLNSFAFMGTYGSCLKPLYNLYVISPVHLIDGYKRFIAMPKKFWNATVTKLNIPSLLKSYESFVPQTDRDFKLLFIDILSRQWAVNFTTTATGSVNHWVKLEDRIIEKNCFQSVTHSNPSLKVVLFNHQQIRDSTVPATCTFALL